MKDKFICLNRECENHFKDEYLGQEIRCPKCNWKTKPINGPELRNVLNQSI